MADILGTLFGKNERVQQLPLQTQQQQGLQNQAIGGAGNLISQLLSNKFDFSPIEQQARTNFQTKTIPGLAERFSGMGTGGQRSGAFRAAIGNAGSNFEQGLAALKSQYDLQQQGQQQNLLQMLLGLGGQQSFQNVVRPESYGLLGQLLGTGSQAAANYLPLLLAGLTGGSSLGATGLGALGSFGNSGGSAYNNQLGLGQQNFAGAFGRGLSF